VLQLDHVSRSFGDRTALDDVSFDVADGRLTGFVGANGAGKTTAMRIVLGVLAADSGQVRWDGEPLGDDVRRRFGYMPEERGFYPKMTVLAQLVYLARLHGDDHVDGHRVEAGERLVEHEHPRLVHERRRDLDPLLVAERQAGEDVGRAVGEGEPVEHLERPAPRRGPVDAVQAGEVDQLREHGHLRVEPAFLGHVAEAAPDVVAEGLAVPPHLA
jgi:ABC-type branched-subunit amino acid transport system ATPase component